MYSRRMTRVLLLGTLLAACAAPKPDPKTGATAQNGAGSGSGVVCHEVTDTGSLFSHEECTPVQDQRDQTEDAQRWLKRPRSEPTATH